MKNEDVVLTVDATMSGGFIGDQEGHAKSKPVTVSDSDSTPRLLDKETPMTPAEQRRAVEARDQSCRWPGCPFLINSINPLECAHLKHRGMGGDEDANEPENGVLLCKLHHDIFDGRQGRGKASTEISRMLATVVGLQ